jgi:hypothetical protein
MEQFETSNGMTVSVHNKGDCLGDVCVIHSPSNHHMRDWYLLWRGDRMIFERLCVHGVGHPDPDQYDYWQSVLGPDDVAAMSSHGCCGCCML